jgi:radical SAM-linked protein
MQRLRIKFSRGEVVKFISHLDIMRLWQRIFIRAGVPLAYSEGFNPHPRISLAAPLALGVTSEAELMDVILSRWLSPQSFLSAVSHQLPLGIDVDQVLNAPLTLPSLQSQVRFAEYRVSLETQKNRDDVEDAIASLMARNELPWQHHRDTGVRRYDLRVLIDELRFIGLEEGCCTIDMRLRCDSNGSGRPEQVSTAIGFNEYPRSIHRTRLILNST